MAENLATPAAIARRWTKRFAARRVTRAISRARRGPVVVTCWMITLVVMPLASSVQADVIYRQGLNQPLIGQVIESNADQIVLQFETPQQGATQTTIPRAEIREHVRTVLPERLESLVDGQWAGYRDYAEELAAYRIDPAAQRLAIRLYLIVAYQTTGDTRRGALQALIALARNPEEEKRFRTLAFRVETRHDPSLLKAPQEIAPVRLFDAEVQNQLLHCLRLARQGYGEQAVTLARKPEVRAGFESISHLMSFREFQTTAYDTRVSGDRLRRLVQLELALMGTGTRQPLETSTDLLAPGWSQLIAQESTAPFQRVTWDNVTEFAPQKTRYQNGTWELP